jgi:TIR domain
LEDLVIRRFEHYFRHPDTDHDLLRPGDRAIACGNARSALSWLQIDDGWPPESDDRLFDEPLRAAVREFQVKYHHRVADGLIGPGTRSRLTSEILHVMGPSVFQRLHRPEQRNRPSVFLSYAWSDSGRVDKLDQWLRDHGVHVIRDKGAFKAGESVQENIARAISIADKIVAILSRDSRNRDWPNLERALAEQLESRIGASVLIYLLLDNTTLPAHDSTRVAISASGVPLKEVGERLLHAVVGTSLALPTYSYDENEPL